MVSGPVGRARLRPSRAGVTPARPEPRPPDSDRLSGRRLGITRRSRGSRPLGKTESLERVVPPDGFSLARCDVLTGGGGGGHSVSSAGRVWHFPLAPLAGWRAAPSRAATAWDFKTCDVKVARQGGVQRSELSEAAGWP